MEYIIQQEGNQKKLLSLKLAIVCFVALFGTFIGLGQLLSNNIVTVAGLLCFTAAAAAITYYMVLTQP
ncbi:MAG: hypothetical protein ACQCN6_03295 [Candidatus Bathyarchaeia archaeon]|jgi:hypothetical protein